MTSKRPFSECTILTDSPTPIDLDRAKDEDKMILTFQVMPEWVKCPLTQTKWTKSLLDEWGIPSGGDRVCLVGVNSKDSKDWLFC